MHSLPQITAPVREAKIIKTAILLVFCFLPALAFAQTTRGDIMFPLKKAGTVRFSHDYHVKTKGVKCAACHFQTFSASGEGFQMKREKLTKRDFCEHCHNGLKGFDSKSEKNCTRCHSQ